MKIHCSGPMTGRPNFNAAMFALVRGKLTDMGHEPFSPPHDVSHDLTYRLCIARNLAWICEEAEGMVLLPGAHSSPGSKAERYAAEACKLPVWEWIEGRFVPFNVAAERIGDLQSVAQEA